MQPLRSTLICLNCGAEIKGRRDKKYCDNQCKAEYHNRHKSFGELYIQNTQRITRHNRKILRTLSPEGKATVRRDVLDQMGYDYRYFSGIFKTQSGIYYLVYDYAFSPIIEKGIEKALIVQRQDYMDHLTLQIWKR